MCNLFVFGLICEFLLVDVIDLGWLVFGGLQGFGFDLFLVL